MNAPQLLVANTLHRKDNDMAKTILVIDDDEMNLRMAELILTQSGYQVTKANSLRHGRYHSHIGAAS